MNASFSSSASSLQKSSAVNIMSALPPGTTRPLYVCFPLRSLSSL